MERFWRVCYSWNRNNGKFWMIRGPLESVALKNSGDKHEPNHFRLTLSNAKTFPCILWNHSVVGVIVFDSVEESNKSPYLLQKPRFFLYWQSYYFRQEISQVEKQVDLPIFSHPCGWRHYWFPWRRPFSHCTSQFWCPDWRCDHYREQCWQIVRSPTKRPRSSGG